MTSIRSQRGLTLILILWIMVLLALLALTLAQHVKFDNTVCHNIGQRANARWVARAGVYHAIAMLTDDHSETDCENDSWFDNPKQCSNQELPGGTYQLVADRFQTDNQLRYGIIDEASKLNINTATYDALLQLPNMTAAMAQAIIESRTRQPVPTAASVKSSMSTAVGPSIESAVAPFETIRQLARIAAIPQTMLFGEDANQDGILENNENDGDTLPPLDNHDGILDRGLLTWLTVYSYEKNIDGLGRPRININTADFAKLETDLQLGPEHARWIIDHRGAAYTSIADLIDESSPKYPVTESILNDQGLPTKPIDLTTFRKIADRITVTADPVIPGRININTAGITVLKTLPFVTDTLAQRIIRYRQSLPQGFTSIAELLAIPEFTVTHFKQLAPLITVRSNVFTVRCTGCTLETKLQHSIEAVIDRGRSAPAVIYWKESN